MASPVDSQRAAIGLTTAGTSQALGFSGGVSGTSAGDLLVIFVRFAGAPGTVTFTGYTQLASDTSDASDDQSMIFYRWCDGTEATTGPRTLSWVNSVKMAMVYWRITGAANPATTAPSMSSVVIGTAANIDPGAVTAVMDATSAGSATTWDGDGGSNQRYAQSFVATGTSITNVGVKLAKLNSPTDDITIELVGDSSGSPDSTVIGSIGTINAASLTTTPTIYDFPCSLTVVNGTTYWVRLRRGVLDSTNRPIVYTGSDSLYPGGTAKDQVSGGSWIAFSADLSMKIDFAGQTKDYLYLTVIGMDSETATATPPSGYGNTIAANSGTAGAVATNCMIWGASKSTTATTSDDPGAWTSSAPNAGVSAWTIAIPPPAPVATKSYPTGMGYRRRRQLALVNR